MKKPIFLIGLMGSGKTTVGKKLSNLLGYQFVDCDQALITRTGVTIAHIFEVEGEDGFRLRETRLLQELGDRDSTVISTGGGVVGSEQNIQIMRSRGIVVYLDVPEKVLWHRLKDCQHRPLLLVENPRAKIHQLMHERAPLYQRAAHIRIQIESDSAAKSARRIEQALRQINEDSAAAQSTGKEPNSTTNSLQ